MSRSGPFQLTIEIVRKLGLMTEDVGAWCIFSDGSYHVFSSQRQAMSAYEKLQQGIRVR